MAVGPSSGFKGGGGTEGGILRRKRPKAASLKEIDVSGGDSDSSMNSQSDTCTKSFFQSEGRKLEASEQKIRSKHLKLKTE